MPTEIFVRDLLSLDTDSRRPHSLAESFGDSYLMQHNPAFRRLREKALSYGTRFSADPPFIDTYRTSPLSCLEDILKTNTVPYSATTPAVKSLLQTEPGLTFSQLLKPGHTFANHVAHETAHCLVYQSLVQRDPKYSSCLIQDLLSEAVAFCADFHCTRMAFDKPHEECFILLNCYPLPQQKLALYLRLLRFMSPGDIHRFLICSYVCVLLSAENLDDYEPVMNALITASELSELSGPMRSELLLFFESLHGITTGFRENCVPQTFRQKGLANEYNHLVRLNRLNPQYVLQEYSEEIESTARLLDSLFADL